MFKSWIIVVAVVTGLQGAANAQYDIQQATADGAKLNQAYQKYRASEYRTLFQSSAFGTDYEKRVAGYREHLSKLEAFERVEKPQIDELLARISSRYGTDALAIRQAFRDVNNAGGSVAGDPAYWWEELGKVAVASQETRRKMADELNRLGSTGGQTAQGYDRMTLEESYDRAKVYLELALAYQPDHAEAKQQLAAIDSDRSEGIEAAKQAVDAAEFGGNAVSFQGDAESMQATAFEYLSTRASGQDGNLLAVRIAGDWHPHDSTLGVTITWGLPVEAAYVVEDDPETARVVSMNLVTQEEHPEPPFQRFVITGERKMRVANLPDGVATAANDGFGLMRLPLSLALIVIGFIGAGPSIQKRIPAVTGLLQRVAPYTAVIGVVALAVGGLALFTSLLSPFQDLLPQAAAIALGLAMGLDILVRRRSQPAAETTDEQLANETKDPGEQASNAVQNARTAADKAVSKAQDLLIENENRIRKLNVVRVPLSISCMALGLVHLLAGGTWLF